MSYSVFKVIPKNMVGRDFVLGDIHGAYDLVIQGMKQVKFDPSVDRIFSVGDMIDRHKDSHRVLEFLGKPYVFAIAGNHDQEFSMLSLDEIRMLGNIGFNGMSWVKGVTDEKLLLIKERLSQLPLAIEIETDRGQVGLVHGDIPKGMDWPTFVRYLKLGDEQVRQVALWGRERIQSRDESGVDGIARVFVGHTIQWNGPRRLGNVYAIDSGAVFRALEKDKGSLTMVNMTCRTNSLTPPPGDVLPVFTDAVAGQGPFGSYVAERPSF